MKVAVIGQSAFGMEVYKRLRSDGHEVVGVFTVPNDAKGREDPLATAAAADGVQTFKFTKWMAPRKQGGHALPDVLETYKSVGAQLNVLAFVTQFIPMEVIEGCKHGSIIYHPSLLPRHRGASAINWTLMAGDQVTGLTVFWGDDGLDTGPILLQKECQVLPDDTVNSLYKRFLFPVGVEAMSEAVALIEKGTAPRITQPEEGASYEALWKDHQQAKIDFSKPAQQIHDFIRGNDRVPGAWAVINGQETTLYGSSMLPDSNGAPSGQEVVVEGCSHPGVVAAEGLVITGSDGQRLRVSSVKVGGQTIPAGELLAGREAAEEGKREAVAA